MQTKKYNKLVRDKIPEIIQKDGSKSETRVLSKKKYRLFLLKKLGEEAKELEKAKTKKKLNEELADVMQVVDSIIEEFGLSRKEVNKKKREKKKKRGGFKKKILLVKTY